MSSLVGPYGALALVLAAIVLAELRRRCVIVDHIPGPWYTSRGRQVYYCERCATEVPYEPPDVPTAPPLTQLDIDGSRPRTAVVVTAETVREMLGTIADASDPESIAKRIRAKYAGPRARGGR
jgi:hypothetical protein